MVTAYFSYSAKIRNNVISKSHAIWFCILFYSPYKNLEGHHVFPFKRKNNTFITSAGFRRPASTSAGFSLHTQNEFEVKIKQGDNKIILKLKCVLDYNNSMGAVVKTDMVISTMESTRKYFFHFLDICVWMLVCTNISTTLNSRNIVELSP